MGKLSETQLFRKSLEPSFGTFSFFDPIAILFSHSVVKEKPNFKKWFHFDIFLFGILKQKVVLRLALWSQSLKWFFPSSNNREWKRPQNSQMDQHIQVSDICHSL